MSSCDHRRVATLLYDGLSIFEFGIVVEIFGLPRPELEVDWYKFETCSHQRGPLRTTGGFHVEARRGLRTLQQAGTIVISGWKRTSEPPPESLLKALRSAHARGARLVSICSGAFVLAATGLLDGKRATTHWRYAEELASRFPKIRVDPGVLYVDEGSILTSAGSAAGIDLCLHIVRCDYGAEIANRVARRLVMPPHRDGGQAQYVPNPVDRPGCWRARAALAMGAIAFGPGSARGGSGPPRGDVAAHFRAPVPPADRNHASPMAHPPASPGCADAARKDRRRDRCDCRSGGATDGGDAAAALQPDAGHDTYRLSPPVLHHVGCCTGFGISRFSRGIR